MDVVIRLVSYESALVVVVVVDIFVSKLGLKC